MGSVNLFHSDFQTIDDMVFSLFHHILHALSQIYATREAPSFKFLSARGPEKEASTNNSRKGCVL
ncbi:hypothetical protein EYZ11_001071 [Aspergillus tanneri]|uniref:Uncharacterized protein n=1 Tax=Aspergillus tanneri TaxID=1220188 RepID=A0A4S3JVL5_9EURO|nr:hypothetical protein EYZ11_001071 [Aspergillus tanneri]